jgi:flavodoxin
MKAIVVYFSYSGNSEKLAKAISEHFSFPLARIETQTPYSSDYDICAYVEAKEEYEKRLCPQIRKLAIDFHSFDRILLFFPIWWYTYPMCVASFVKEYLGGYEGTVEVYANSYSNDPSYMSNSLRDLRSLDGSISFKEGLFNKSLREHIAFIGKEGD